MCSKLNKHGVQRKVGAIWSICVSAMVEMVRSAHGSLNLFECSLHLFHRFAVKYFVCGRVLRCPCISAVLLTFHPSHLHVSIDNQQLATVPCSIAE